MASAGMDEQQQALEEQREQEEQREKPAAGEQEGGSQPPAAAEAAAEASQAPAEPAMPPPESLASQVMASSADLLATQVMAHTDGPTDLLATQVMAPAAGSADLLATQVVAATGQDTSATQAVRHAQAPMQEGPQVEFEKPTELKQVKRPKSAYWLFLEENRGQVTEELGPGVGATKVSSAMAAKWKCLDEAAKAKFVERAKELRAQYDKDIADGAVPTVSAKRARAAGATKKRAAAKTRRAGGRVLQSLKRRAGPKKPKGSYSIWLCEHRKEVKAKLVAEGAAEPSFEAISRAAGKAWMALTAQEKAPYMERAQQLMAKFKDINKACKEFKKATAKDVKAKAAKKRTPAAKAKKQTKAASKAKKPTADKAATEKPESPEEAAASGPKATPRKAKRQPKAEEAGAKAQETPQKRAAGATGPTPKKAKKVPAQATAYLDMALVAEAEKAGFGGAFRKMAEREDMKPYAQRVLLDALVASGGLLHRAKDAVLASQA